MRDAQILNRAGTRAITYEWFRAWINPMAYTKHPPGAGALIRAGTCKEICARYHANKFKSHPGSGGIQ